MVRRKNIISIEYELNDIERKIYTILSRYPASVHQIRSILRFEGIDISSMYISKKLNELFILGLIKKKKKNSRIYIYFIEN